MTRLLRHAARRLLVVAFVSLLCAGGVAVHAYWSGPGVGTAGASIGTLAAPTSVTATPVAITGVVRVTWSVVTAPDGGSPTGYVVTRTQGASTASACGSSLAAPLGGATVTCDDTGVPAGTYTYAVTAVYRSWTAASSASSPVVVAADATPPSVSSIVKADASPTAAASVRWTVTFSESVSGVGTGDFTLLTSGTVAGTSLTSVSGSAATYTVTAATGSGTGTLTLRLVDDDTIVDVGSNPLGGSGTSGAGDGSITGAAYTVDKSAPTAPVITLDQPTGNTWISGTTAFIAAQASNSGTFRVTATTSDTDTGIDRVTFPSPLGLAGGGDDTTSPYQTTYSWTAATASLGALTITAMNGVGLTSTGSFTLTWDVVAPNVSAPTVTAGYYSVASVPVTLPSATDAGSGVAAGSVIVQRDSAALGAGTCAAFPSTWTPVTLSGGADTTVVSGRCYRYRQLVSDNVGNQTTSAVSGTARIDTSAPSAPSLSIATTGNTYASGSIVFINPQVGRSGSFTVTATTSEPESTITNVTFPPVTGITGGAVDTTSPYSAAYTWSGAVAASGAQTVTALNAAALTSSSTFTVQPDTTAPTGGAITANGGSGTSSSATIALSVTAFAETATATASGLSTSVVTRQSATLSSGTCGTTFTGSTVVAGATDTVSTGSCYRWVLTGTDRVGNAATATSGVVMVDTTAPSAPSVTLSAATGNSFISGTRVFVSPQAGFSGGFTVTATSADTNSGINRITFPTPSGMTGGGDDTTSPYSATYSWSGAIAASGSQTVTAINNTGLSAGRTFTVTPDVAAPTGGALTVNGTAASAAGTTSISGTGTYAGTRTNFAETASATASGLASSTLTRANATASGVTCGPFGAPTTIAGNPSETALAVGCYRYTLTGVDRVGNAVSLSTTVIRPAIAVAVTSVANGGPTTRALISGTATAGAGSVTVVVCSTATSPCTGTTRFSGTAAVSGGGTWSITTGDLGVLAASWTFATQASVSSAVFGPFATPVP